MTNKSILSLFAFNLTLLNIIFLLYLTLNYQDPTINYSRPVSSVITNTSKPGSTEKITPKDVLNLRAMDAISPDGKYIAYFWTSSQNKDRTESNIQVQLIIQPIDPDNTVGNYAYPSTLSPVATFPYSDYENKFLVGLLRHTRYYSDLNTNDSRVMWSNSGKILAISLPDKLMIYEFTLSQKSINFERSWDVPYLANVSRIFFSGDDTRLYLVSSNVDYLDITSKTISSKILSAPDSLNNLSPIPYASGLVYWTNSPEAYRPKITIDNEEKVKSYLMPDDSIDYPGKILLSPDSRHVCVEYGSSGYHGYLVLRLSDMQKIFSGQQYSYCRFWLNNSELLVVEKPYFHQNFLYWYKLNTTTNKKVYFDRTNSPD